MGLLLISVVMALPGCNKNVKTKENEPIVIVVDEDEVEAVSDETLAVNPLTGLMIDKEVARRRPVAVMINNIRVATPQSGISQADIIYETLAEGNITRLVAVFQDFDSQKIGPVRSTRHYYLNIAFDHDAIFVHHGGSPQAFESIKRLEPANLNSLSYLESIMAWRDPIRSKKRGMYEHSLYTSAEGIQKAWNKVGYREERKNDLDWKFSFTNEENIPMVGDKAEIVVVPFSKDYTSSFKYIEKDMIYSRFQFGEAHIDENNNEQLKVKNIIIQYANIKHIPGDSEGRRDIDLVGQGQGLYISNGKAVPITWRKNAYDDVTKYRDEEGKILKINKGKTWICIFPNNSEIQLEEYN